ncbi:MAG: tetratricopeptide repeat protein [Kiloniellales bacterium]|nr:tetratricopeptide repeat protein [Kiloniellales bacterium]
MIDRPRRIGVSATPLALAGVCLSALLAGGALAAGPTCGQVMTDTFTEHWGLPQGEDRYTADLNPVVARCSGEAAFKTERPGTRDTYLGLQEYANGRDEAAIGAWQKGAAAGDPLAMIALGDQEVRAGLEEGWAEDGLEKAHAWYRKAADAGSPLGMSKLAWLYDEGHHVEADEAEATAWYMKAAEAGEPTAMRKVGDSFRDGKGVAPDIVIAIRWYVWAGEAGDEMAFYSLAVIYDEGALVPEDDTKAVYYYRIAALAGVPEAMLGLGSMYHEGAGVEQDYEEAAHWYESAMDAGVEEAGAGLGLLYYEGTGVEKDQEVALQFFVVAAVAGRPDGMAYASLAYTELGEYEAAYFWALVAITFGVIEITLQALELREMLPEAVVEETEAQAAVWTPGSPAPEFQAIQH